MMTSLASEATSDLPRHAPTTPALLGHHPSIVAIREDVARAARLELPVLVQGETGTGKEIVAQLLHRQSGRRGPMVALNVGAVPDTLAESEFFGVMRGAFTGAYSDRPGHLEDANGGTLFLDEASELSVPMQVRLLRVLESGEVRRVGGRENRKTTFRLVLSAQKPASELMTSGQWRRDFLYRVSGVTIVLPRLVERGRDVVLLANHYLAPYGANPLQRDSDRVLLAHGWPGNVRELRAAVARAVFLTGGAQTDAHAIVDAARALTAPSLTGRPTGMMRSLRDAMKAYVKAVLEDCNGDAKAAARILGISRATVYRQLQGVEDQP